MPDQAAASGLPEPAQPRRLDAGLKARRYAQLLEDPSQAPIQGAIAPAELARDRGIAGTGGQQAKEPLSLGIRAALVVAAAGCADVGSDPASATSHVGNRHRPRPYRFEQPAECLEQG